MLDIKSATTIKKAINKELGYERATLEDVCRMEPLPITTKGSGYNVLGMQYGDMSVLVWVQFNEKLGVIVRNVCAQPW